MQKKNKIEKVSFVLSADNSYWGYLGVTLCSLYENSKINEWLSDVYILDGGISQEGKKFLNIISEKYKFNLFFLDTDKYDFSKYKISHHISKASYFRIAIPWFINDSRVLYLDSDLLVLNDIGELFKIDMKGHPVAAVEEGVYTGYRNIGLKLESDYFNAGVLVIDIQNWSKQQVSERSVKYLNKVGDDVVWWDQDALNYSIKGKWFHLDSKYNYRDIKRLDNASVFHFVGKIKPWNFVARNKERFLYLKYSYFLPFSKKKILLLSRLWLGALLRFGIDKIYGH